MGPPGCVTKPAICSEYVKGGMPTDDVQDHASVLTVPRVLTCMLTNMPD